MRIENSLEIIPLIDSPEFIEECIELLNEEWPRSLNIRRISLQKTLNNKPPLSLILINKEENKLIGYSRLCPLPPQNDENNNNGCWIESVVVWRNLRGKGFGKILMNGIEECAKEFGFRKIFLSTIDKSNFYIRCGYSHCSPIFNFGSNSKLFERSGLINLFNNKNINENKTIKNNSNNLTKPSPLSPPPPPLLLPPIFPKNNSQKDQKFYLTKII